MASLAVETKRGERKRSRFCRSERVGVAREAKVGFGFNEYLRAQDGIPCGQDWQIWSAAMYLDAAHGIEQNETPFFDEIRSHMGYQ
jgi:hypothetical protein